MDIERIAKLIHQVGDPVEFRNVVIVTTIAIVLFVVSFAFFVTTISLFTISTIFTVALFLGMIIYLLVAVRRYAAEMTARVTKELSASREWFRELYENAPIPYIMVSPAGYVRQPNKASRRLFEKTGQELYDTHVSDLFADEDILDAKQYFEFFRSGIAVNEKEIRVGNNGGKTHWALFSLYAIPGAEGTSGYGLATFVDITERKAIEGTKTEFLSLASHQLRTPLATVKWYLGVLRAKEIGSFNEKQEHYLDKMYHSNQRLIELVDLLLNVTRIEIGTIKIHPEQINIVENSKDIIEELMPTIRKKNLIVTENYSDVLPPLSSDPKFVRVIMQNLISNAVKYTPDNNNITVTIKEDESKYTFFSVEDTGCGISEDAQEHVFKKLYRAPNAQKFDSKGIGLGLYMTKSFTELLGGTINFNSTLGRGSKFWVLLPPEYSGEVVHGKENESSENNKSKLE
jgi:PAS domain S-box-containing protein